MFGGGDHYGTTVRNYTATSLVKLIVDTPTMVTVLTGIRSDTVGVDNGMPTKELSETDAIILGRTHGDCNACHGHGKVQHFATNYPFAVDNVREFAEFLIECDGFEIC